MLYRAFVMAGLPHHYSQLFAAPEDYIFPNLKGTNSAHSTKYSLLYTGGVVQYLLAGTKSFLKRCRG